MSAPASKPETQAMLQSLSDNLDMADKLVRIFYHEGEDGTWKISDEGIYIGRYFESGGSPGQLLSVLGDHIEKRLNTDTMAAFNPNSIPNNQRYKLIFYVPKPSLEAVKSGVFAVDAGTSPGGKYTSCSFESPGTSQFQPDAERGANPKIGKLQDDGSIKYRLEKVEEVRCEVLCVGRTCLEKAVEALKRTHPYEEPAYEAYKIEDV